LDLLKIGQERTVHENVVGVASLQG